MSVFSELKRRNVLRAAAAYIAVAWLLIQVAETTFPAFGFSDDALRSLIIVLAVGFVPAVVLAWVFEITPEGLVRDRDMVPGSELSLRTRKMLDRGILVVLALGIAYFAFDKFVLDPARDEAMVEEAREEGRTEAFTESFGERSIAVLPFANLSADPEQEYFGDGLAEEILHLLSAIPELRVISRSSSFAFKGRDVPVPEIAGALNVGHVLEGSVRKSGNTIRVTAQLIDGRSDTHLWSETWDRSLDDIFAIQDEIATEVASRLELELAEPPRSERVDPAAYELFLKGRYLWETFQPENLVEAEAAVQRAVEIQPDYADAWLLLSGVYYRYFHAYRGNPDASVPYGQGEAYRLSTEAMDKALALAPDHPLALSLKGYRLYYDDPPDEAEAARLFERSVALGNYQFGGEFAGALGQRETAVRLTAAALQQDPMCNWCRLVLAQEYLTLGDFERAELMASSLAERKVGLPTNALNAAIALEKGEAREALELLAEVPGEESRDLRVRALYAVGRTGEADELLASMAASADDVSGTTPPPYSYLELATLNAELEREDAAFEWLQKAVAGGCRVYRINFGNIQQRFEAFDDDPRWKDVARRCNRSPEQIAEIDFDPVLPE
ncbi:MAG: hypothetical protein P8102_11310 [Gammaproteobacteria bacterium]